jgi:hypothetical protein
MKVTLGQNVLPQCKPQYIVVSSPHQINQCDLIFKSLFWLWYSTSTADCLSVNSLMVSWQGSLRLTHLQAKVRIFQWYKPSLEQDLYIQSWAATSKVILQNCRLLHFVKLKHHGMLERVNLGVSGINVLWILNPKRPFDSHAHGLSP